MGDPPADAPAAAGAEPAAAPPPRRRLLTPSELRAKASFRAMNRLLEEGAPSEAALWAVARVMSGAEARAAGEERALAGLCASALCGARLPPPAPRGGGRFRISLSERRVYEAVGAGDGGDDDDGGGGAVCCSEACAAALAALDARLGTAADAQRRFDALAALARERRRAAAAAEAAAAGAPAPPGAPAGGGILKKKGTDLAAGTPKAPIMLAEVKERTPGAGAGAGVDAAAPPPCAGSSRAAAAVEGYVPRPAVREAAAAGGAPPPGRRVRFSDEQGAPAPLEEEAAPAPAPALDPGAAPVLVFDVEGPSGPLEGDAGLGKAFGRLRVAPASELGLAEAQVAALRAAAAQEGGGAGAEGGGVRLEMPEGLDVELARRLRRGGAAALPKLAATLPPGVASAAAAPSDSETDGDGDGDDAALDDTDDDSGSDDGRPASRFRLKLTFFGTLFSHLEAWVTHASLAVVAAPPSAALPPPPAPPAPEVAAAAARFVDAAAARAAAALRLPPAACAAAAGELLGTFRFAAPLPALSPAQWDVAAAVLLKAMSLERAPALRPAFETRAGVGRLHRALGAAGFTSEEFYAVLELVVPPEEGDEAGGAAH